MKAKPLVERINDALQSYRDYILLCRSEEQPNWVIAVHQTLHDGIESRLNEFDAWVKGVYDLLKVSRKVSFSDSK